MATTDEAASDTPQAYDQLLERYRKLHNVQASAGVLGWDQRVKMPEGGTPARAQQLSTLSSIGHELLIDDDVGTWLEATEDADLTGDQAAVVREIRRQYDRAVDVPADLVEELTAHQAHTQQVWQEAKAADDFSHFAPALEELIELQCERATAIDPTENPYRVMYEDRLPHLPLETVERIFEGSSVSAQARSIRPRIPTG